MENNVRKAEGQRIVYFCANQNMGMIIFIPVKTRSTEEAYRALDNRQTQHVGAGFAVDT